MSLALRENILQVNGSRIQNWWIYHHYVTTVAVITSWTLEHEHESPWSALLASRCVVQRYVTPFRVVVVVVVCSCGVFKFNMNMSLRGLHCSRPGSFNHVPVHVHGRF
jgi:hypothetical protein